jgi:membrane glycosyltransferase
MHPKEWSRIAILMAGFLMTGAATLAMADLLAAPTLIPLDYAILALFAILFFGLGMSFVWVAIGFFLRLFYDPFRITAKNYEDTALAKTAIVMPVFNEECAHVFASLRVMFDALKEKGVLDYFSFFIMSDSNDPENWLEEEFSWAKLVRETKGYGSIFYRRRRMGIKRKSGNVADFCRRWGAQYRYMIVLDADSLMTADIIVRLVKLMEANPKSGIIQSAPALVNRLSLFGRIQQFASRLYGPIFAAGLNFWQRSEGNFWGHNAIIRLEPFIAHCALATIPGSGPLSGPILSHDFVEAALMRRAGYEVWLAYDLVGSYEESPPTILDYAARDRRWCQGNLQHWRLLTTKGLHWLNRWHLLNGVMSYLSAPLWLLFLFLNTLKVLLAFGEGRSIMFLPGYFATTQKEKIIEGLVLLAVTIVFLFGPKVLAMIVAILNKEYIAMFGGRWKAAVSALREAILSVFLAPIFMMFHTEAVLATLLGIKVGWGSQRRTDEGIPWSMAIAYHGLQTILGLGWGVITYLLVPTFFFWLSPVIAGLVLSIPICVYTSKPSLGLRAMNQRRFLTPEETFPTHELALANARRAAQSEKAPEKWQVEPKRMVEAIVDPISNGIHVALQRYRQSAVRQRYLENLLSRCLQDGPLALTKAERLDLLYDRQAMCTLHEAIWDGEGAWWQKEVLEKRIASHKKRA